MGWHLEQQLDARLRAIASLTAQMIERSFIDLSNPEEEALLRLTLNRIRFDHQLEAVYLIDSQYRLLIDATLQKLNIDQRNYLRADSQYIHLATTGTVSVSALHQIDDNPFKSVYAAVTDLSGHEMILVMEANADFLRVMATFHRGLYIGIVTSAVVMILLTIFLIAATSLLLRTEERLQQAQRLAYLGQMSATVAHEIRNPLAIIKSTTDVLREKVSASGQTRNLFQYIDEEISRLNRLVNDFLSFSKEPRLQLELIDLSDLLCELVEKFTTEKISIQCLTPAQPIKVRCDGDMIRRVVANLLINAIQATEETKAAKIIVQLSTVRRRKRKYACVSVRDFGVGLQGRGEEIFEPFYTTKASGTGLGLAISRQIIQSHMGSIEAVEPEQGGTIVRFMLPM